MTLAADTSPVIGRPTYLGIWRELADAGVGIGPLILSGVTALAGLGPAFIVSGGIGFFAAAALWRWIPKNVGMEHRVGAKTHATSTSSGQAESSREGPGP
jgi:hypothetical protein